MSFYILKEPCILVFFEISLRCKTSCNALEITLENFFNVNDQKMSPEYLELLKNAQELTTVDIFGDCSVDELPRLNHLQHSWRTVYEASRNGNFRQKELAKIQTDDQMNDDLQNIRQVLNAYEMASVNDKYIEVNGVRYYYNSTEIEINENLISQLKAFPAKETAYSICCDESQGLIIHKFHRAINTLLFPYTHAPRKRGAFFVPILKNCTKSIDNWCNIRYNKNK